MITESRTEDATRNIVRNKSQASRKTQNYLIQRQTECRHILSMVGFTGLLNKMQFCIEGLFQCRLAC